MCRVTPHGGRRRWRYDLQLTDVEQEAVRRAGRGSPKGQAVAVAEELQRMLEEGMSDLQVVECREAQHESEGTDKR